MNKKQVEQCLLKLAQASGSAMKALGQGIKDLLSAASGYYKAKQRNMDAINQQAAQQLMLLNQQDIANTVRWGLFCAFSGRRYPYLQPVQAVSDIVIYDCTHYAIPLSSMNPVPACGLHQIAGHMNQDIQGFIQRVLMCQTRQQAWNDYPFLMAGLYVANVQIDGIYAVITVALPQPQYSTATYPSSIQ